MKDGRERERERGIDMQQTESNPGPLHQLSYPGSQQNKQFEDITLDLLIDISYYFLKFYRLTNYSINLENN